MLSNWLKKHWKKIALFLISINLLFSSWYALHGDLYFGSDNARDFLLLHEIEQKGIILIGASAGGTGFFHGVFWPYLNYPVFWLSNGNPVASAFFWVFLIFLMLLSVFWVTKKLFNETSAYVATVLFSYFPVFQAREFTNPTTGLLFSPLFFYSFYRYTKTLKARYLICAVLINGILIHFEIASGLPLLMLSGVYALYLQIKHKKLMHIFSFLSILMPLSTYVIFDLRHNFLMTNSFFRYLRGNPSEIYVSFKSILENRFDVATGMATNFLYSSFQETHIIAIIFFLTLGYLIYKKDQASNIYKLFLYFFFGFFLISLRNRYYVLSQHITAFIPLVFIMFASVVKSKLGKYFYLLFFIIAISNIMSAYNYISQIKDFTGINEASWKFYRNLVTDIFTQEKTNEFGYFIYTPDKLSYAAKYALVYGQKKYPDKTIYYFQKKPVTYVLVAPPPVNDPYMLGSYWVKNSIKIDKKPESVLSYPNGYRVERYELTPQEIAIPFDPTADTGIHFR